MGGCPHVSGPVSAAEGGMGKGGCMGGGGEGGRGGGGVAGVVGGGEGVEGGLGGVVGRLLVAGGVEGRGSGVGADRGPEGWVHGNLGGRVRAPGNPSTKRKAHRPSIRPRSHPTMGRGVAFLPIK